MSDASALLQQLGFGDYEAKAYLALLQRSPLNGYEVAKASGIPRANVYAVLQKLEDRGVIIRVDTPESARFVPVPPDELTQRLASSFQSSLEAAKQALADVVNPVERAYIWNARGYSALLDHARSLLESGRERIQVALSPPEAAALAGELRAAEARGIDLTTLCLEACPNECGGCRGRVYRYRVRPDQPTRWLVIVVDGEELLAGEIGAGPDAIAARTRQRLLVELAGWYIRHSIALAGVIEDLGDRLEPLLKPETRELLAAVGPGAMGEGWLEHMRRLLRGRRN